jgi:hypothetical protein
MRWLKRLTVLEGKSGPLAWAVAQSAAVEMVGLKWADRFNDWRLLEPIGNVTPAEVEAANHAKHPGSAIVT